MGCWLPATTWNQPVIENKQQLSFGRGSSNLKSVDDIRGTKRRKRVSASVMNSTATAMNYASGEVHTGG